MARRKYLYLGVLWLVAGGAMSMADIWIGKGWFTLWIGPIGIPIGPLVVVFGGLNLVYHVQIQRQLRLTEEEIRLYHDKLAAAAHEIVALMGRGVKAGAIADRIEESHGIPRLVTLKYIIALGDEKKRSRGVES